MTDVYDQHAHSFVNIAAWVILKDGERVATFATKYGRGGSSGVTLTAYLHVIGLPMVRFREGPGGGYAMKDAAFRRVAEKAYKQVQTHETADANRVAASFKDYPDAGEHWDGWLRSRGYQVEAAL